MAASAGSELALEKDQAAHQGWLLPTLEQGADQKNPMVLLLHASAYSVTKRASGCTPQQDISSIGWGERDSRGWELLALKENIIRFQQEAAKRTCVLLFQKELSANNPEEKGSDKKTTWVFLGFIMEETLQSNIFLN